jgi:hypothetical protein
LPDVCVPHVGVLSCMSHMHSAARCGSNASLQGYSPCRRVCQFVFTQAFLVQVRLGPKCSLISVQVALGPPSADSATWGTLTGSAARTARYAAAYDAGKILYTSDSVMTCFTCSSHCCSAAAAAATNCLQSSRLQCRPWPLPDDCPGVVSAICTHTRF